MKLNKLVIQGFKSFKDKTVIQFDKGITGIVGPNGCGKSNIVDALFWVMGEQSAKHLRGSSMKDVIFSGSSKYPPASWAEVSLFLENSEQKHVHVGDKVICPSEFQLTRKLYRNGDSDYRINGIPARLKDIQEVFLDTGVGTKSYSIIAQGEINKLVQAGPQEKRMIVEEVAGITRFKVRKKESLKKLELTEQNLSRLMDLKQEVYKQLKLLEEQADKAERAIILRERVQQNELIVEAHKELELLSSYSEKSKEFSEINLSLESGLIEREREESFLTQEKVEKELLQDETESLQKEYNELAKKLAGSEERLKYLIRDKDEKRSLLQTRTRENESVNSDLENRTKKLNEWQDQLEKLEEEEVSEESYLDLQNHVDILFHEITIKEETISGLKKEIENGKEQLFHLRQDLFKAKAKKSDAEEKFQEVIVKIDITEKDLDLQRQNLIRGSALKDQKDAELRLIEQEKNELSHKIKENQIALMRFKEENQKIEKSINKIEAKLVSLSEMKYYDLNPNLQNGEFLKEQEADHFERFFNLIKCDDLYIPAIQKFLGYKLESLMMKKGSDKISSFDELLDWWKEQPTNPFIHTLVESEGLSKSFHSSFIEHILSQDSDNEKNAWVADQIVTIDDSFLQIKEMFKNLVIVKSWDKERIASWQKKISEDESPFVDLITLDGKVHIKKEYGVVILLLGSDSSNGDEMTSPIKRNNEIDKLKSELEILKDDFRKNEDLRTKPREDLKNFMDQFQKKENLQQEIRTDIAVLKNENENIRITIQKLEAQWDELKKKRENLSKDKLNFIEKEGDFEKRENELKSDVEDREETLVEVQEDYSYKKSVYTEEKEKLIVQKGRFESYSKQLDNLNRQVEDVEDQIEKLETRKEENLALIEKYHLESEESEKESLVLDVSNKELAKELREREKILQESKKKLSEKLENIEKRDKGIRILSGKLTKWEKDLVLIKAKSEQTIEEEERTVRNIFEKYRVNLRKKMMSYLELTEENLIGLRSLEDVLMSDVNGEKISREEQAFEFHRKYGQELQSSKERYQRSLRELQNLGEINWTAVDEFIKQKKRHQFLADQELQLKKSLDDLKVAIGHIDERCKERFKNAFHDINERFQKVFPILFGGGEAYLQLQGPFEDLDAGVDIVARPPGKKMQNINLMSGGEKAMTAVSLIFSTFLVRPSPFCLLDEVDAPLDDANVTRFNEMLREMSDESQFILITHNKKTMELNDVLYGITMQEPGISKTVSVQLQ